MLFVLMAVLSFSATTAASSLSSREVQMKMMISSETVDNLLSQAAQIWDVALSDLYADYNDGRLKIAPADTPNWYEVTRQTEGGLAIIVLEELL